MVYYKRFELFFTINNQMGPKLSISRAFKYLKNTIGWVKSVLGQFGRHENIYFSGAKGRKWTTILKKIVKMVNLGLTK